MKIVAITPVGKTDTIAEMVILGLYENNIEVIATDLGNSIEETYTDEEILNHANNADFIFCFWSKSTNIPKYYLLDKINKKNKTAYFDGSEWCITGIPNQNQMQLSLNNSKLLKGTPWLSTDMLEKSNWYFKRECYEEDEKNGIIPLNVTCANCEIEEVNETKEFDVFLSFNHTTTGLRGPITEECKKLQVLNDKIIIESNLKYYKYINFIKKSNIAISAWGAGNSCRRMWEILSKGTCCFAQKNEILVSNNFTDGKNIVFYSSLDEFKDKLNFYLKNKELTDKIGVEGREHFKKYHTPKKRVEYILNILNGKNWKEALL